MSTFECSELNHVDIKYCRREIVFESLSAMIDTRAETLFRECVTAEARFTMCMKHWWLRDLNTKPLPAIQGTGESGVSIRDSVCGG